MVDAVADSPHMHVMQCMEIWGGNQAARTGISLPGIDAWLISEPYAGDQAGGDIHYLSLCAGGKIARLAVADVAGHGQAVGDLAGFLRSLMRKHINRVDQTRFVRSLNGEFSRLGEAGLFATALLLTYFAPADRLVTCNAGHPPPLWYRSDKRSWQRLEHDTPDRLQSASNLPLGVISPTHYHQFVVPLAKGDLILVYTDSLVEAADPHGRQLGEQGLLELVRSLDVQHPGAFPEALLEGVSRHRGDAPSEDDVTVLLLHHNAVDPPRRPVGERVNAIAKMLGLRQV